MNLITESDDQKLVDYLVAVIAEKLQNDLSVLWLVPGGSAMKSALKVFRQLEDEDTSKLCITLTDERYGEPGHADENWTQLEQLGFDLAAINAYRVLRGEDAEVTAQDFADKLERLFATYDYKIGLFGIGADGHTAGIKPGSPAVHSEELAVEFEGEDFRRITMTPVAIAQLDETTAYAHGQDKFLQLARLVYEDLSLDDQPAQALKLAKKATLFSDYSQ